MRTSILLSSFFIKIPEIRSTFTLPTPANRLIIIRRSNDLLLNRRLLSASRYWNRSLSDQPLIYFFFFATFFPFVTSISFTPFFLFIRPAARRRESSLVTTCGNTWLFTFISAGPKTFSGLKRKSRIILTRAGPPKSFPKASSIYTHSSTNTFFPKQTFPAYRRRPRRGSSPSGWRLPFSKKTRLAQGGALKGGRVTCPVRSLLWNHVLAT